MVVTLLMTSISLKQLTLSSKMQQSYCYKDILPGTIKKNKTQILIHFNLTPCVRLLQRTQNFEVHLQTATPSSMTQAMPYTLNLLNLEHRTRIFKIHTLSFQPLTRTLLNLYLKLKASNPYEAARCAAPCPSK